MLIHIKYYAKLQSVKIILVRQKRKIIIKWYQFLPPLRSRKTNNHLITIAGRSITKETAIKK